MTAFHVVWDYENPQEVRDKHQQKFSLNVWGGIIQEHLIGPYFFPNHLNGETYLLFLRTELIPLHDAVPLEVIQRMLFMHDGAPPYFTLTVRQYLDNQFQNRRIGRGGSIA